MDHSRISPSSLSIRTLTAALLVMTAAGSPGRLLAADGDPDPTFGVGGGIEIAWDLGGDNKDVAKGIAADFGGNLFVVGFGASATADKDWEIARIDAAGGIVSNTKFFDRGGTNDDLAEAVVLDGNGGLVVAGVADDTGTNHLELCRFTAATLAFDPAFGTAFGCEEVDYGASQRVSGLALARAGDGGFIVAGTLDQSGDRNFFATRFSSTGHVDPNFGFFGVRVIPWNSVAGGYDALHGLAVDLDGGILLAGEAQGGTIYTLAVLAKLSAAGNLDPGFGSGGKVVLPSSSSTPNSWEAAAELDLRAGTRFGVANFLGAGNGTSTLATYMVDGAGQVSAGQYTGAWDFATANYPVRILFQSDGAALVAGYHSGASGAVFDVNRAPCLDGCALDIFWGSFGSASFSPSVAGWGDGVDLAAVALSGGRPVLAGTNRRPVNNTNWLIVRLANRLIFRDGFDTGDLRAWPDF